jgi:hypothetical protein
VPELGKLIKEEDSPVAEAYFSGLWPVPAADQTSV